MEKYNIEKDIAAYIKKEFDKKYNPTWHAIVGRNFGSYVTHETKHFIYFYLGQVAILLFKSGWNWKILIYWYASSCFTECCCWTTNLHHTTNFVISAINWTTRNKSVCCGFKTNALIEYRCLMDISSKSRKVLFEKKLTKNNSLGSHLKSKEAKLGIFSFMICFN